MIDLVLLFAGVAMVVAGGALAYEFGVAGPAVGENTTTSQPARRSRPLKPDERRILRLLGRHDGELRQSEVVDRLDWSKAKASRLLSNLETTGDVEKIDVGRENLIVLTDDRSETADEPAIAGRRR